MADLRPPRHDPRAAGQGRCPQGTLAIVLLDRRTQQAVWSSAISWPATWPSPKGRQQLSQQLAAKMLNALPH